MYASAYLLKNSITVVLRQTDHYRLVQLPTGSVFYTSGSSPDPNGMIDGTCQGNSVLMFSRDLEERAEPIAREIPHGQLPELETQERRRDSRYPITLEVEYTLLTQGDVHRFGCGRTANVSSNGVLFEADDVLPTGAAINLAIKWPSLLDDDCRFKLQVLGRIVRSDDKQVAVQIAHCEFGEIT